MRTIYKAKTLVPGYKVANNLKDKDLVAVPLTKLSKELYVSFDSHTMPIPVGKEPLTTLTFEDKFGRGSYTLAYYEWKPQRLEFGK